MESADNAIRALVDLSRLLADDATDPADVPRALANVVRRHLAPEVVAVYLTSYDGSIALSHCLGRTPEEIGAQEPGHGLGLAAVLTLPLASSGDLFGTLVIGWEREPGPAADQLAAGLADIAATALARAHRTRELVDVIRALEESRSELARTESLRQLGQMAAVVAHEVKNPLASISGVLQVLRSRPSTLPGDQEIVGKVLDRLADLDRLVDELLRFARPREPTRTPVPLRMFVQEVDALFRQDPASGNTTVHVEADDGTAALDPGVMQRVVLNLLLNAAQAAGDGGRIELSARRFDDYAEIVVDDNGPGIAPELRERVFEPFYTTKVRGTGLGLAIARQAVEAHHGTIKVEASSRNGTRFVIRLPCGTGTAPA